MGHGGKYKPFPAVKLRDRQWPSRVITRAPIWCSSDLRDGNQALKVPMVVQQKIEMFEALVGCGFKEIEVGFPSASQTEYEFVRRLIEEDMIPSDVTIQVLVQAREDLIKKTVESLAGARRVIIHMYNSTSPAQRKIVFRKEKPEVIEMAVQGTKLVKEYAKKLQEQGTEVVFQYSPESFSATEPEFALEICEAVMAVWQPTPQQKMIINLPETVEVATPNVYADQVEWFCTHLVRRDCVIISVHTHNDRSCAVAAAELALLAGADRVEGTLFGNGERTGNCDIVTMALNMYTQGVEPELDFSNLEALRRVYERCTGMLVPPRQPYSGELVFTAFSGSHQDAIKKGLEARAGGPADASWEVAYLVMDPADVGRKYEGIIRVNSQSGKAGVAYLLEGCGIRMPKDMQREFGPIAGKQIDALGQEVTGEDIMLMFEAEYLSKAYIDKLSSFESSSHFDGCNCTAILKLNNESQTVMGHGNGPIDAFVNALRRAGTEVRVLDQAEHALGKGADASAIAYVKLQLPSGAVRWGSGIDPSIDKANVKAVISALNRG